MSNFRIFVEKKTGYQTEAENLLKDYNDNLHLNLRKLRLLNIYDVYNVSEEELEIIKKNVLSEVVTDNVYDEVSLKSKSCFAIEYLPGNYNQRADSAEQCSKLMIDNTNLRIKSGKLIIIDEEIDEVILKKIKSYTINPIETREKNLNLNLTLSEDVIPKAVSTYTRFINYSVDELSCFHSDNNFAMSLADLKFIQKYFKEEERRNPSETELFVLDTYWSDHCRHTTFETILTKITFPKGEFHKVLQDTFNQYLKSRQFVHGEKKPITLMDIATITGKEMYKKSELTDLEVTDEINACSIYIDVDVDEKIEKWLLMFKNETHNHPTEIEPFGGASTCIGGAIRDPLSGRAYVYQAMRVTGAADITEPIEMTLAGKLPQKIISKKAAEGYSSYGNQIGLATTHVREIYHEGYKAKRMEVGAVVGAVNAKYVKREKPSLGDIIILIGGKTGRDGIGGATGSSKEHNELSINNASSEVQKGNAVVERKIQRLFRNPDVTKLIKKSNDFGAGGVCVAIGELADGLEINIDDIPTKYSGLNPTELTISESQERMAVVISKENVKEFYEYAAKENLEATAVAIVTDSNRLIIKSKGNEIVNISRDFLNTNGVQQETMVEMNEITTKPKFYKSSNEPLKTQFINHLKDKNIASLKGLVEMFDSTIGTTTVLMPYGGKTQLTEVDASVQKIPVLNGKTNTCSIMTYGYNPKLSSWSPFHGAIYAVIESIAKVCAVGGNYKGIRFSFQEYFKRLGKNPENWGLPFASLLGAYYAQNSFGLPAIGGKDSMSGTFKDLNVPPTLISFAVQTENTKNIISPEFKETNNYIYLMDYNFDENYLPNINELKQNYDFIHQEIKNKNIISAFALKYGGLSEAIAKMSFGNRIGINITNIDYLNERLFEFKYGAIVVESKCRLNYEHAVLLGETTREESIRLDDEEITIDEAISAWLSKYEKIYPTFINETSQIKTTVYKNLTIKKNPIEITPQVFVPIFPGTNCEYDSMRAFKKAGAKTKEMVFKNQCLDDIKQSINTMVNQINQSQIIMLSGGFSSGDEPDGSGKFISAVLTNEQIRMSIERFLERDGLILGICNGFQALVKSGLLPYGLIGQVSKNSPSLVKNSINRHVSKIVNTKIVSNKSPWFMDMNLDTIYKTVISHGEGKFVAPKEVINQLFKNGQVATQYVDDSGNPTMNGLYNPNGSFAAIEGISSFDGRILGKMGHSERYGNDLYKNIYGNKIQDIFTNGVRYFKG